MLHLDRSTAGHCEVFTHGMSVPYEFDRFFNSHHYHTEIGKTIWTVIKEESLKRIRERAYALEGGGWERYHLPEKITILEMILSPCVIL